MGNDQGMSMIRKSKKKEEPKAKKEKKVRKKQKINKLQSIILDGSNPYSNSELYMPQIQGVPDTDLNYQYIQSEEKHSAYPQRKIILDGSNPYSDSELSGEMEMYLSEEHEMEGVVEEYQAQTNDVFPAELLATDDKKNDSPLKETNDMIGDSESEVTSEKSIEADDELIKNDDAFEKVEHQIASEESDENDLISNKNGAITMLGSSIQEFDQSLQLDKLIPNDDDDDQKQFKIYKSSKAANDMIGDSESDESSHSLIGKNQETIIGQFEQNEMLNFKSDKAGKKEKDEVSDESEGDDVLLNQNGAVTMIGDPNDGKIEFNLSVLNNNKSDESNDSNSNDSKPTKQGPILLMGSAPNNIFQKKSDEMSESDIDSDGDMISPMNGKNDKITMIGIESNAKLSFKQNNNKDLSDDAKEDEHFENEGKIEKNSVLTDLQNIKDNVVNALPDPSISFDHPSHPKNDKKNVYNYADNMISVYDNSSAFKKSMDNTYKKKKKESQNKTNRKRQIDSKNGKRSKSRKNDERKDAPKMKKSSGKIKGKNGVY